MLNCTFRYLYSWRKILYCLLSVNVTSIRFWQVFSTLIFLLFFARFYKTSFFSNFWAWYREKLAAKSWLIWFLKFCLRLLQFVTFAHKFHYNKCSKYHGPEFVFSFCLSHLNNLRFNSECSVMFSWSKLKGLFKNYIINDYLFECYGLPIFVGYLMPNPFYTKKNSSISNNLV